MSIRRIACYDENPTQSGETGDDVFHYSIGEIFPLPVVADIDKGSTPIEGPLPCSLAGDAPLFPSNPTARRSTEPTKR